MVLAEDDVSLEFEPTDGQTASVKLGVDPPQISIPTWHVDQPITSLPRVAFDLMVQRTLTAHEVAHVNYTDNAAFGKAKSSLPAEERPAFHSIFNALEDGAIEEQLRSTFDVEDVLAVTNANFRFTYDNDSREYDLLAATQLAGLDLAVFDSGILGSLLDPADNPSFSDRQTRTRFVKTVLPAVAEAAEDVLEEPEGDARVQRILELWRKIRDEFDSLEPPKQPTPKGSVPANSNADASSSVPADQLGEGQPADAGGKGEGQSTNSEGADTSGEADGEIDGSKSESSKSGSSAGSADSSNNTANRSTESTPTDDQPEEADQNDLDDDEVRHGESAGDEVTENGDTKNSEGQNDESDNEEANSTDSDDLDNGTGASSEQASGPSAEAKDENSTNESSSDDESDDSVAKNANDQSVDGSTEVQEGPDGRTDGTENEVSPDTDSEAGETGGTGSGGGFEQEFPEDSESSRENDVGEDEDESNGVNSEREEDEISEDIREQAREAAEEAIERVERQQDREDAVADDYEKAAEKIEEVVKGTDLRRVRVRRPDTSDQVESNRWREIERDGERLGRIFDQRLQNEQRSQQRRHQRRGQLDPRALPRLAQSDPRVFRSEDKPDEKEYAIILVLDRSGSMSGTIGVAEQAVAILSQALESIGIQTCLVEMYRSSARIAIPFTVDTADVPEAVLTGETSGGTPLAEVLHLSREYVSEMDAKPAMLTVTDGKPSDEKAYFEQLDQTPFPVLGVYVDTSARSHRQALDRHERSAQYYDERRVVIDPDELTETLEQLAREVMF
jgi:Mg-chelatase subunit ChlD